MKKVLMGLFCCGMFFCICGCENNKNSSIDKIKGNESMSNNNCSLDSKVTMYFENEFSCPAMKNIKYGGGRFFITNDGELYEYSDKNYSTTDNNCKKIDTNVVFEKIIRDTLIDVDGNLYSYDLDSSTIKLIDASLEKQGPAFYGINQMNIALYRKYNNIFYLKIVDINEPHVYGLIDGNNVYSVTEEEKKLIYTFSDDEEIEKTTNGFVITNKGYYTYDIVNKTECQKYEDIKCEYGLVKVETKSNCIGSVIYISDALLVNNEMVK